MNSFPNYKNKNILILGLGLLGRGIKDTIFFVKKGANVTVTDLKTKEQLSTALKQLKQYKNIKFVLGKHRHEDIDKADLIIRNADVPLNSEFLQYAFKKKKLVEMDESMFAEFCPCPIIGITGTRGKTTTATLIYEFLKKTDKKVYLAGNIMGQATLPLMDKVKKNDLVVLELSSWQLQGFGWKKISPQVAVFTNIYPDHLNRYKGMRDYIADKRNIYKWQHKNDYFIANSRDKVTSSAVKSARAKIKMFSSSQVPKSWEIKLFGEHNLENISAAIQVAKIFKVKDKDIRTVLARFKGVEHRLEFVKKVSGIDFINDTTSTTPIAGQMALASLNKPIILIAGGATKQLELKNFSKDIAQKVKAVVLLKGTATDELKNGIVKYKGEDKILGEFDNFEEAVKTAFKYAEKGDVVLLSPGCASFGMFTNEFDRGEQFKKIVKDLR
ncbi:UDP-N-acetylmuramoylalanine--D-glutamate ligase [Candidatus Falkowbacteria bacterium RIFOXYD2_FULL_35_9]|uniref:UDP-N-acetylmuramoylalanine--D-glutamate ligase n=1 Tax=Candidatus Falkowbacteria bacterium RIFOXYC2_FULL_36_12 TaxID=1798002 RepID=A0A1F5SYP3_9BACT|nr:MAG: UDP-N-acetylmuramoylalanine--D-glutamate ligase [Candidatus Falkowbacteria bacterium RIFOXYB2_FULL_35_7]OGF31834.1 MAG: UDP-N-acetylmuramoylalanine--D-glutamate ligase [Candidatus Falkowbacteria bacterium RIFOXYC2_FULL_36_12]OGF34643.1 MAG: UDP-N-acetylmuramoylalanine--D-glutamate ligase [Candidatus Falkowbacteria bacterium RIFOXYA2_FULL_35_8]OGF45726.1 MAG: UDP-N-acetylmuramoylalanine--D-glutamate ligase [Candidatus Falkowbacteria bacterium RIFOXYD2_FULL_35_9]